MDGATLSWTRPEPNDTHTHKAHPIPLYESDNYIYYVEGLQLLQWLLLRPRACQQVNHFRIPKEPD